MKDVLHITDTDRIGFLEDLLCQRRYSGQAIVRWSTAGRGLRLIETSSADSSNTIRDAIDKAMAAELDKEKGGRRDARRKTEDVNEVSRDGTSLQEV